MTTANTSCGGTSPCLLIRYLALAVQQAVEQLHRRVADVVGAVLGLQVRLAAHREHHACRAHPAIGMPHPQLVYCAHPLSLPYSDCRYGSQHTVNTMPAARSRVRAQDATPVASLLHALVKSAITCVISARAYPHALCMQGMACC